LSTLRFIETFDGTISLQPGEPIDPKDPVELIDLVLEAYGKETIDLFHAAQILVVHPHTGMVFDLFRYARHGDAAFFVPDHVGGSPDDLRVDVGSNSILTVNPAALDQTSKSATDTANNAYVEGISNKDWVDDTLMRLRSEELTKTIMVPGNPPAHQTLNSPINSIVAAAKTAHELESARRKATRDKAIQRPL
jgi:hypothetical protein